MRRLTFAVLVFGLCAGALTSAAPASDARQFNTGSQYRARISDREVQQILTRVRTGSDALLRAIDAATSKGSGTRAERSDVGYLVDDLAQAAVHLNDHIIRRETTQTDVEEVLRRGVLVDEALTSRSLGPSVQNSWTTVRRDLDRLAQAYALPWDWRNPTYSGDRETGIYARWTGTYSIDAARSDNPQTVVSQALRTVTAADRARITRQLENRLTPPDRMAIDRQGSRVTIASSTGPQLSFDADGQTHTEAGRGNRTITTRASIYGDALEVTTTGGNNTDYAVMFEPVGNGQSLRVTRRLRTDGLRQPVSVQTTYRRTSDTPDWSLYNNAPPATDRPAGAVVIPDGTTLVATLDQAVNLRSAREDDRVTLTVRNAPRPEWEGATIEGFVTAVPTQSGDRTGVSVGFDQIRLRNGRTGTFDGDIDRVVGPNGRDITFDRETRVDSNDRQDAIKRGAIGATIGAIIGAIAGGGKGAAIGAAIGGGGAAATVFIDGSSATELPRGTEFTIRSRSR